MAGWTTSDIPSQIGRTAVVTGTGGIGFHISAALARAGANVIVAGRNAAKGAAAVEQIREAVPHAHVRFGSVDLASLEFLADRYARDKQRFYHYDGYATLSEISAEQYCQATTKDLAGDPEHLAV